jgi:hypothetical protein
MRRPECMLVHWKLASIGINAAAESGAATVKSSEQTELFWSINGIVQTSLLCFSTK